MGDPFKVGDDYPVWWNTEREKIDGGYFPARIIDVFPYRGRYPQHFTHVLRLTDPNTKRGWSEMAVDGRSMPGPGNEQTGGSNG